MTTRTRQDIINDIIEFFEGRDDLFNDAIEELDSYNGYLGDDRYYSMYDLDELVTMKSVTDILNRAFFGYDENTWHTDSHGQKEYGAFNPNRDYFKFNAYGNLISTDYPDYSDKLDSYAVEEMVENRYYIDTIDKDSELSELFNELENYTEEETEQ